MSVTFYAHFNSSEFKIAAINTHSAKNDDEDIVIAISEQLAERFLVYNESLHNWVVCLDENEEWTIAKKSDVQKKVASRIAAAHFIEVTSYNENADALLRIMGSTAVLQLSEQYLNSRYFNELSSVLTDGSIRFYITRKRDPSHLLEVVSFYFQDLIDNNGVLSANVRDNYGEISIFTKKIFSNYSLEIV